MLKHGAEYGCGIGRTGQAYAIPTKDRDLRVLPLHDIGFYVREFIGYAAAHPDVEFYTVAIGCGLAGYTPQQIAPMFASAPSNIVFLDDAFAAAVHTPAPDAAEVRRG